MALVSLYGGSGGPSTAPTGIWSRADLLSRVRTLSGRPATDQALTDARIDAFLTEAQSHWVNEMAAVVPQVLYGAPVKLLTIDSGRTYTFGTDADGDPIEPIGHVELLEGPTGPRLEPGSGTGYDGYLFEGGVIRWPRQAARTFPDGPYARFVTPPDVIDASHEPTLTPKRARTLLVYHALALWAFRTNRDPAPWLSKEQEAWTGVPGTANVGLLGALRTQYAQSPGPRAVDDSAGGMWYDTIMRS